jgi:hypothetical protein
MAYSAVYSPVKQNYPLPSGSLFFGCKLVPSTGLSRSFSAIVRFQFQEARKYNPNGIRVFLFFLLQLLMRVTGLFLIRRLPDKSVPALFASDAVLSILFFVVSCWPFILSFYINMSNL